MLWFRIGSFFGSNLPSVFDPFFKIEAAPTSSGDKYQKSVLYIFLNGLNIRSCEKKWSKSKPKNLNAPILGLGTHFEKEPFKISSSLRLPRRPQGTNIKNRSCKFFQNGLNIWSCANEWSESKPKKLNTPILILGTH